MQAAERGKDQTADDPAGGHAYASDQANESGRSVEVVAAAAEEVRERERGGGSGEKDDGDEHFAPLDQRDKVAEELREGLAGEAAIRARRLHEGKSDHRQQDGCPEHQRDSNRRKVAYELVAADGHDAKAADVADRHPDADGLLLLGRGDGGEPAADGALIEIGGEEADGQHGFQQREVIEVQKGNNKCERGDDSQRHRVPAAAESDIEDGAEEKRPEAGRKRDGGQAGDRCLGHMAVAQQLRDREGDHSAVKAVRQVGETHEPDGNPMAAGHAAGLQCNRFNQVTIGMGAWDPLHFALWRCCPSSQLLIPLRRTGTFHSRGRVLQLRSAVSIRGNLSRLRGSTVGTRIWKWRSLLRLALVNNGEIHFEPRNRSWMDGAICCWINFFCTSQIRKMRGFTPTSWRLHCHSQDLCGRISSAGG